MTLQNSPIDLTNSFLRRSPSIEETENIGTELASKIDFSKRLTVIAVQSQGCTSVGKTTLLFGLVKYFIPMAFRDFKGASDCGRDNFFRAFVNNGVIISYDAHIWRDNPRLYMDDRETGIISVEHPELAHLETHQLKPDINITLIKTGNSPNSPRDIRIDCC